MFKLNYLAMAYNEKDEQCESWSGTLVITNKRFYDSD